MRKERRTFSAAYKAKVAIEAIKEQQTTSELAHKYQLHPNQISLVFLQGFNFLLIQFLKTLILVYLNR